MLTDIQAVIFGGHIDTWDVTDGSMDDGGGVMMAWEVGRGGVMMAWVVGRGGVMMAWEHRRRHHGCHGSPVTHEI